MNPPPFALSVRTFGLAFAAALGVLSVLAWRRDAPWAGWTAAAAVTMLLVALARPALLHPLQRAWAVVTATLNRLVSLVVLVLLFYGVMTPMGLLMRAVGRDALRLRRDRGARTYWVEREPPGPDPQGMRQQF